MPSKIKVSTSKRMYVVCRDLFLEVVFIGGEGSSCFIAHRPPADDHVRLARNPAQLRALAKLMNRLADRWENERDA